MRLGLIPSDISSLKRKIVWSFRKKFHFKGDKEQSFKMRSSISYLYKIIPTVCCSLTYKRKRLNESTCWYDEANLHIRYSRAKMPRLITHSKLERVKKGISLKNRITFGFIGFSSLEIWLHSHFHERILWCFVADCQPYKKVKRRGNSTWKKWKDWKSGRWIHHNIFLDSKVFYIFFILSPTSWAFDVHFQWNARRLKYFIL